MRSYVQGRTLTVLLALGGCAQHRALEEAPGAEGSLRAHTRGEDDVDADRTPSGPPVVRAAEAARAEATLADTRVVTQREAVARTDRDPTAVEIAAEQEHEVVEHCARMRSLPSWCVERERARVRKRGAP